MSQFSFVNHDPEFTTGCFTQPALLRARRLPLPRHVYFPANLRRTKRRGIGHRAPRIISSSPARTFPHRCVFNDHGQIVNGMPFRKLGGREARSALTSVGHNLAPGTGFRGAQAPLVNSRTVCGRGGGCCRTSRTIYWGVYPRTCLSILWGPKIPVRPISVIPNPQPGFYPGS